METIKWSRVLLQWVKDTNLIDVPGNSIENCDPYTFFEKFREKIVTKTTITETDLIKFLQKHFPHFEVHLDDNNRISTTDYMYIYSLLLLFCCVKYSEKYFQQICSSLKEAHQLAIATFFKSIFDKESVDRTSIRNAIHDAVPCKNLAPPPAVLDSPARHPCASKSSPPTPKTIIIDERTRELKLLKAQLEGEKYEKGYLEMQMKQSEEKINKLMDDKKQLTSEIRELRSVLNSCNSENLSPNRGKKNEMKVVRYEKKISEKDDMIEKLKLDLENMAEDYKNAFDKIAFSSKQIAILTDKIKDLEISVQNLNENIEQKDELIKCLQENNSELQNFIKENRMSHCTKDNSIDFLDFSFTGASTASNNSSSRNLTNSPENLGNAVVDVQLKEKEYENSVLRKSLDSIEVEKNKVGNVINMFFKRFKVSVGELSGKPDNATFSEKIAIFTNAYDTLYNNYDVLIGSNEDMTDYNKSLKSNITNLEEKIGSLKSDFDSLKAHNDSIEEQLQILANVSDNLKEKNRDLENENVRQKRDFLMLISEKDIIQQKYIKMVKDFEELSASNCNLKVEFNNLREEYESMNEKIDYLMISINEEYDGGDFSSYFEKLDDLKSRLKEMKDEKNDLNTAKQNLEHQVNDILEAKESFKMSNANLKHDLEEMRLNNLNMEAEKNIFEQNILQLKKSNEELMKNVEKLENEIKVKGDELNILKKIEEEKNCLFQTITELKEEKECIEADSSKIIEEYGEEINDLKLSIKSVIDSRVELENQHENLQKDFEDLKESSVLQVNKFVEHIQKFETKISKLQTDSDVKLTEVNLKLDNLSSIKSQLKAEKKQLEDEKKIVAQITAEFEGLQLENSELNEKNISLDLVISKLAEENRNYRQFEEKSSKEIENLRQEISNISNGKDELEIKWAQNDVKLKEFEIINRQLEVRLNQAKLDLQDKTEIVENHKESLEKIKIQLDISVNENKTSKMGNEQLREEIRVLKIIKEEKGQFEMQILKLLDENSCLNSDKTDLEVKIELGLNEKEELESNIQEMETKKKSLESELLNFKAENQEILKEKVNLERQMNEIREEREEMSCNLLEISKEKKDCEAKIIELEKKIKIIEEEKTEMKIKNGDLIMDLEENLEKQADYDEIKNSLKVLKENHEELMKSYECLNCTKEQLSKNLVEISENACKREEDKLKLEKVLSEEKDKISSLEKEQSNLQNEREKLVGEKDELTNKIADLVSGKDNLSSKLAKLEHEFNEKSQELEETIKNVSIEKDGMQEKISQLEFIKQTTSDYEIILAESKQFKAKSKDLLEEKNKLEQSNFNLEEKLSILEEEKEKLKEKVQDLDSVSHEITKVQNNLEKMKEEKETLASELKNSQNEKDGLEAKLKNADDKMEHLNIKLHKMVEENKTLLENLQETEAFKEELMAKLAQYAITIIEKAELEVSNGKLQSKLAEITKEMGQLDAKYQNQIEMSKVLEEKNVEMAEIIREKIENIEKLSTLYEFGKAELAANAKKLYENERTIKALQSDYFLLKEKSKDFDQNAEELLKCHLEITDLTNKNKYLSETIEQTEIKVKSSQENTDYLNTILMANKKKIEDLNTENTNLQENLHSTKMEKTKFECSSQNLESKLNHKQMEIAISDEKISKLEYLLAKTKTNNEDNSKASNLLKQLEKYADTDKKLKELEMLQKKEAELNDELNKNNQILLAKLMKHRAITEDKEKCWDEERVGLLDKLKAKDKTSDDKIKDIRLEYEGKLEKMKEKMKTLYTDEVKSKKTKYEKEIEDLALKLQKLSKKISQLNEMNLDLRKENELMKAKARIMDEMKYGKKSMPPPAHIRPEIYGSTNLKMEDEEGELFNNTYLTDLKNGKTSPIAGRDSIRFSELMQRNSMCPPHLRSSYAVQYESEFSEDDFRDGAIVNLDDSSVSLISRRKTAGTSYKRPGPPTPSKSAGRLSFGSTTISIPSSANSVPYRDVLKDQNNTLANSKTPGKFKSMFSSSSLLKSLSKDENTPPRRRLSIFRNKK